MKRHQDGFRRAPEAHSLAVAAYAASALTAVSANLLKVSSVFFSSASVASSSLTASV